MSTTRVMREVNLYPPVRRWLREQGYRVYPEQNGHDIAAIRGERVPIVELKMCLSRGVCMQLIRAYGADVLYAAVASTPRSLEICKKYGLGVLRVTGEKVDVILEPVAGERFGGEKYHAKWIERLQSPEPLDDEVAGLPTLAGDGPAKRCAKRIQEYLANNPKASWRDIYRNVPNHYAHYRSLQGAMPPIWQLQETT